MNQKTNEATNNRPEGTRVLDGPAVHISLPHYLRQLKEEAAWTKNDRNAITLLHSASLRIVLIGLHQGAEMSRHTADGPVSIQVVQGRLWLQTDELSISLDEGEMIALQDRVAHSVFAEQESVFLLTIAHVHE